jgi:two-component system phosphate regulon sensor histidine kinase PhoR
MFFKFKSSFQFGLFIGGIAASIIALLLYLFKMQYKDILVITGIVFFSLSIATLKLINLLFMDKIELLNRNIYNSINNTKMRQKLNQMSPFEIERLEFAVKRLIKEKTIEIDNLKELERFRRDFLGDVAHELRSPIFNIQGYIHTLLDGAIDDESVRGKFINKAAQNADHLSSLVEDLVTISRIESGELTLDLSEFDIIQLVSEIIDYQDLIARTKNITLVLKNEIKHDKIVKADKAKIKQVLINLINNSIKYGKQNGKTQITITELNHQISLEVADNGEGIAEEHLPRIFERFYRVDKARARNTYNSTGLGLAIVKHLVEAHNEKILVTSREGIGTIFSFNLTKVRNLSNQEALLNKTAPLAFEKS